MLKFPVYTFYQTLFSIFPSAIFPLFPSTILFPSKSFPHQKAQSKVPKAKAKKTLFLLQGNFITANRVE
jgi:hypothetical protein